MKPLSISLACLTAVIGAPMLAFAQETPPERPAASVRAQGATHVDQRWYGVGDVNTKFQLCVVSNTGRFELQLLPETPGAATPGGIEVIFSTQAGEREVRDWDGRAELLFSGRALDQACDIGGNVAVELRFKRQDLIARLAGDHPSRIRYSVSPA